MIIPPRNFEGITNQKFVVAGFDPTLADRATARVLLLPGGWAALARFD